MRRLTAKVFDQIKEAVETKAEEMKIGGFMIVADFVTGVAMFDLVNKDTPLRIGVEGKRDANFASVAGAKFGMVFAHRRDTGFQTSVLGEVDFQGGHISADGEFAYCFSGAVQEDDLALMVYAEEVHKSLGDE